MFLPFLLWALALLSLATASWRWWRTHWGCFLAWFFGGRCDEIGWVDGVPHQCVLAPYHHGPHQSAWHPELHVRVRWFSGEFGQASSVERKPIPPVEDLA